MSVVGGVGSKSYCSVARGSGGGRRGLFDLVPAVASGVQRGGGGGGGRACMNDNGAFTTKGAGD
jgi:hypothetical protein